MGLQKKIDGPYGIVLNYHKINRILTYFDGSGKTSVQVGSFRSREESQEDGATAIKVHHFDYPESVTNENTVDEIKAAAYESIKNNSEWEDAEDVVEG